MLRPRPGARHQRQHRRSGRRHRRPVDRRAGHPADDADLPHRRYGPGGGNLVLRGDQRRYRQGVRPDRYRRSWRSGGHEPQRRGHRDRRRQGPRILQGALRRAPARQGRRRGGQEPAPGRVGPLHHPDPHGSGRRGPVRGPGRRPVGQGRDGRGHGHRPARRLRLARQPARRGPASGRGRDPGRRLRQAVERL
ncbi:hypothetical protein D3C77_254230 [compost metagenome]